MTKHIAIFGDSILRGVVMGNDNRYHISKKVDWQHIEQLFDIKIDNCSKMGICASDGKKKLQNYLATNPNIDYIILEYGGNDCDYYWQKVSENPKGNNLPKTNLVEFRQDLIEMINLIREKNIKPILITLPPIVANRYFDFIISQGNNKENIKLFLGDIQIIYRRQEMYSNEIMKIAKYLDVNIVDVRQKFLQSNDMEALFCKDGIHPNSDGHKLIVQAFLEYYHQNDNFILQKCKNS